MLKQRRKFSRKKEWKSIFLRILFYLIFLAFIGTILYVLFFANLLRIISINISGNDNIKSEYILDEINPKISGKYLNFLEKNNLLLVRTKKIEKNILNKFKGIKEIGIKRKFPDGLEIEIQERIPRIIFCAREKCLILDENGQAYESADSFLSKKDRNDFLKLIDESGKEINLEDTILNVDYINYIENIKEKTFKNFNFEIENEFRTPSIISNDIKVKTKSGWVIYFNREIDFERELEMLKVILKNGLESEQQRENLEYIDLRVDSKIFYKFRDDTPEGLAKRAQIEAEKEAQEKIEADNESDEE